MAGEGFISPAVAENKIIALERELREAKERLQRIQEDARHKAEDAAQARDRVSELERWLLDAKKLVHGQAALRGALWEALEKVAPNHPLISGDYTKPSHPTSVIINEAKSKVRHDSPWLPQ